MPILLDLPVLSPNTVPTEETAGAETGEDEGVEEDLVFAEDVMGTTATVDEVGRMTIVDVETIDAT